MDSRDLYGQVRLQYSHSIQNGSSKGLKDMRLLRSQGLQILRQRRSCQKPFIQFFHGNTYSLFNSTAMKKDMETRAYCAVKISGFPESTSYTDIIGLAERPE